MSNTNINQAPPITPKSSDFKDYMIFMLHYSKHYKMMLWFMVFAIGIFIIAGRLIPITFGWAVDFGISKKDLNQIYFYGFILLFCNLLRTVLSFVCSYGFRYLGQKILFHVRKDLIAHTQKLPLSYFDKTSSGRIVTRISNDTRSLGELFAEGFSGIFINLIEIVSIIVSLFFVSWPLAILTLIILPPVLFMSYRLSEKIKNTYIIIKSKLSNINAYSAETLDGIQVIQLYGGEEYAEKKFAEEVEEYKRMQLVSHKLFAELWPLLELFQILCIIFSLAGGLYLIDYHGMTVGHLSAFILLLQGFFRPLRFILEKYNQVQNGVTSSQRIIRLFKERTEDVLENCQSENLTDKAALIEIKNLNFAYDKANGKNVLHNVNLKIHEGQKVAIVGRTGSGKTTLVSLLQRFYKPQDQSIFIEQKDINKYVLPDLRKQILVLRQEEFLFKGTLRTNIQLGKLGATEEQLQSVKDKVQLKQNLDSQIDEMGSNLSAGERQLVALARVLLFDPKIVILDEATSHIDSVSERKVLKAINEILEGRTSIIIAHRLSTVMDSDLVLVLKDGVLVEQGTPTELLNQDSYFKGFYKELL